MLRNYFKVTLRALRKQAGYTAINVAGLGLGLACCFLIVLFVQHERSFDPFHDKADRIYRLLPADSTGQERQASTASGFAPDLSEAFPEIERAVRLATYFNQTSFKLDGERRQVTGFALADPAVFDVFTFPLLRGDPETALVDAHSLVVSESGARALFGEADPLGRTVTLGDATDLTVTGVMADVPAASTLRFDFLGSFNILTEWRGEDALREYTNYNYRTYLLLQPGTEPAALETKFRQWQRERFDGDGGDGGLVLQPLTAIHFDTGVQFEDAPVRDVRYVYVFSAVAVLILLIACVNFTNLATARATQRAKEVGVRKAVGAERGQLVAQFLGESVLLSAVALGLALVAVALFLPVFNGLIGAEIAVGAESAGVAALLVGIGLGAGLLAGLYPALYLSAFSPARVLKGELTRGAGGSWLRRGLIVFQFAASIALLVGTLTVYDQLRYLRGQDLGFDREQVLFLQRVTPVADAYDAFRQEALADPRVLAMAQAGGLPGRTGTNRGYNWPGQDGQEAGDGFWTIPADPDYVDALGLELVAGRTFSREVATDTLDTYVLNETAARQLGWAPEEAVGKPFRAWDRPMGTVIGVVKDFHFQSLHEAVQPVVLNYIPWFGMVAVRVAPEGVPQALDHLRATWEAFAPEYPFAYTFLDEDFARLYEAEAQLLQRFTFFAGIAVFIACLGLFGLAAYAAQQRTKEIGVRKVLGASVGHIVLLLSRDFARLVLVALVVAAPLAYLAMSRWLEGFAYRIALGPGVFLLAGLLALALAFVTVSTQALRAATTDPVKALRYE